MTRNCPQQGHVWREGERPADEKDYPAFPLYVRHKRRTPGMVAVFCQHCDATGQLQAYGKNTSPIGPVPMR